MTRIAIIGGGISGLAAAFALEQHRRAGTLDYTLYEASPRLGGVLRTEHIQGCIVEAGPDSFITEKPWAADLCRALGIGDQLIGSNDADRKTYILVHGRLIAIPDGLMFMVPTKILPTGFSPLFSWKTKLRMARELFHPPRPVGSNADESVAALVERHYGAEMVDRLADPLLSGIYGGEAARLSVRAVLPRFAEMERLHGSLGRAMLAARKKMPRSDKQNCPSTFHFSQARHAATRRHTRSRPESLVPVPEHLRAIDSARSRRLDCLYRTEIGPLRRRNSRRAHSRRSADSRGLRSRARRRTRRHRLHFFHHRWPRL